MNKILSYLLYRENFNIVSIKDKIVLEKDNLIITIDEKKQENRKVQ